jgi:hypothetical protein
MGTSGRFGARLALALLLALPLGALANEDDEGPGQEPGIPEPAPVEEHPAPMPAAAAPAPPPVTAPATPHPAAPAAGAAPAPAAGSTAPAAADAPKRLGRPFPTPITPPPPPEDPTVHVTIIPSGESSVGQNRIRGGGNQGAGAADEEHDAGE